MSKKSKIIFPIICVTMNLAYALYGNAILAKYLYF